MDDLKFPFEIVECCYQSTIYNQQISYNLLHESIISIHESDDESFLSRAFGWIKKQVSRIVETVRKWVAAIIHFLTVTIPGAIKKVISAIANFFKSLFGKKKVNVDKNTSPEEKEKIKEAAKEANNATAQKIAMRNGPIRTDDPMVNSMVQIEENVKKKINEIENDEIRKNMLAYYEQECAIVLSIDGPVEFQIRDVQNELNQSLKQILHMCLARQKMLDKIIDELNDLCTNTKYRDDVFKKADDIGDISSLGNEAEIKMIDVQYKQTVDLERQKGNYFDINYMSNKGYKAITAEQIFKWANILKSDKTGIGIAKSAKEQSQKIIDLSSTFVSSYKNEENNEKVEKLLGMFSHIQNNMTTYLTDASKGYAELIKFGIDTCIKALRSRK